MTNEELILAAVPAAGVLDADWEARLLDAAKRLQAALNPKGQVMAALEEMQGAAYFTGTIIGIHKEPTSQRGVVAVFTGNPREPQKCVVKLGGDQTMTLPAIQGVEYLRTKRTDSDPHARSLANHIRTDLIGYHCTIVKTSEEFKSATGETRKMRQLIDARKIRLTSDPAAIAQLSAERKAELGLA